MKTIIIILSLTIITFTAQSQASIQIAPYSFRAWGCTPHTISVQAQYKGLMVGYYRITHVMYDADTAMTKTNTLGAFYKHDIALIKKNDRVILHGSAIAGVFNHRFPTDNGAWWAFGLNLNYNLTNHIGIYYQHLSNGWTTKINPGLDNIGLKYSL